jgi:hypothetical protein
MVDMLLVEFEEEVGGVEGGWKEGAVLGVRGDVVSIASGKWASTVGSLTREM